MTAASRIAGFLRRREPTVDPRWEFHSFSYLRHNARRLEHLASLRIPVAGKRVLELGAGIGDHTAYYLDRGCHVTSAEARPENLEVLRNRYSGPGMTIVPMDLDSPSEIHGKPFDVVHCYGLLYHLKNPQECLGFISAHCGGMLFLETCVSFGTGIAIHALQEDRNSASQAFSGWGCRPTRPWVFGQLEKHFQYVFCPTTQPNHEEFPIDWTAPEKQKAPLQRAIFVASRSQIKNDQLVPFLPDTQLRCD